jgi:peptidoglycan hydrolase-like protein with peptidoglycan-binding domain
MTITMFDSINVAELPAGSGYAYAGYVNGQWRTYSAIVGKFLGSRVLSIAVSAGSDADCLDIETGDATPEQAASWVLRQLARKAWRPCLYASVSTMGSVIAGLEAAGISISTLRLWSAHYGEGAHICGPASCKQLAVAVDGTQWTDSALGRSLDQSLLSDGFFQQVTGTETWEAKMVGTLPTVQSGSTNTTFVRRVQGLCLACLTGSSLKVDGSFGPSTEAAVKMVQGNAKIAIDGVVGQQTWSVLVTGS